MFDNVFNAVMNVKGKTKDNPKARMDLKVICKRPELELKEYNGKVLKPKAKVYACTRSSKAGMSMVEIVEISKWIRL